MHARVLYIDIDIHHGDGVQEAFYNSNRVLTVSFHKYSSDFFPGTGHIDEVGHSLGKYFSLNVPLQDGIDNESYVSLFKSIMEPTITTFQPSSIVLQCGADSLGCDRLGCFNLSIAAHGECVRFIKSFNLPLVVLGGGGYTIKNVSRCWTYETAVLLDLQQSLPNSLPHTAYDDFFAPDWKLHPDLAAGRNRIENLNTRKALERIRIGVLERLRYMHGAPSVAMVEIPPGLAPWLKEEDKDEDDGEGTTADSHRANGEWYDGDRDRELDGSISISYPPPGVPPIGHGAPSATVLQWGAGIALGGREKRAAAISASASLTQTSISENQRERPMGPATALTRMGPDSTLKATKPRSASGSTSAGVGAASSSGKKRRKTTAVAGASGARNPTGKNGRSSLGKAIDEVEVSPVVEEGDAADESGPTTPMDTGG